MEATYQIRLHPDGKYIPIIALSADAFIDQQEAAFEAGISAYLTKPLDFARLVPILMKHLHQIPSAPLSAENGTALTPLPDFVKKRLLEEFDVLAAIPPFDAKEIKRQVEKMLKMCKSYESIFVKGLLKIQQSSLSRNSQEIPGIITEILHDQYPHRR